MKAPTPIRSLSVLASITGALLAGIGQATAEEGGTLTLEIGGESATFALWAEQSDWSGTEQLGSVNIYAQPADAAAGDVATRATLGFSIINGMIDGPEVSARTPEGVQLWGEDEQGGLSVTVDDSSVSGDFLTISGSLTGQMGPSENFGREIDLSSPVPVSGTFAVTLGPVE